MIYTQRIFWPSYNSEAKLSQLLDFLGNNREVCDEISFFTEGDGLDWRYLPRDEVECRADFLTRAVQAARAAGFATAINVLNTMGHSDGGEDAPRVPWRGIVGTDGVQAKQCSCPFDEQFLEYCRFKYEHFARCGADKIWIDDDVRLNNHSPVGWGCFCDACLADFSRRVSHEYSREQLVAVMDTDSALRSAWLDRNNQVMLGVLEACAQGVACGIEGASLTKPVEIGFMTCDLEDLADWRADAKQIFERLGAVTGDTAWLRPGGGFWNDANPRDVLSKIHHVGNSVHDLPQGVRATYEIENYPYAQGGKSAAITGLECLLVTLSTRLGGLMFNVLDHMGNDLSAFDEWTSDLKSWRELWDEAARLVADTTPIGWRPYYSRNHIVHHTGELQEALNSHYTQPLALQPTGIPLTAFAAGTQGHLLNGRAARGLSRDEMEQLLQRPLLMDAEAAGCFVEAGLGAAIGVEGLEPHGDGVTERFTDHALNGKHGGYYRTATLKYFGLQTHALQAAAATEVLSELHAQNGESLGAALILHRSQTGVAVAVMSYLPWHHVLSPQRMAQLQNLSDAMLGERSALRSNRPVVQWRRRDNNTGRMMSVLFNAGFDAARNVEVSGACDCRLALSTPGVSINSAQDKVIADLPAWSVGVVA